MTSVQDRLKTKQRESRDTWSTREQLCLASSVLKSGDQNWISVSRSLKPFAEKEALRPPDWFSHKSCANQYTRLIENVDTPKRKKRESGETIGESIVKRLTQERTAELGQILAFQRDEYQQLKSEVNLLKSGTISDDKLQKMWSAIEQEEREQEQKAKAHSLWLAKRQQKQDVMANQITASPLKKTLDLSNDTQDSESANDEEEKKSRGPSTLLTNLLKSPSPTKQIQNPTSTAQVTSPTIASLLSSSATVHMTQTPQTVTAPIHQLVTSVIPSTPERPSAGAPTLSMLLALPANLPKGTLPALPSSKSSNASETGASRSASSKQTTQAPAIQVSSVETGDIDTDNVGEIIERIDDVIGKDKIPDVIDKDEMNEIMEDIEELIKEEITKSPSTSESASVVIETFPVAQEKTEERLESKIDEPIALAGSPESEMAIEEIDQSTPDIAEIIGTAIETSKDEAKIVKKEDDSEENKPEKMSTEGKEKEEEIVAVENKSKEEIEMIVDEEDKVDEDKESKSKEEMDEKFIESKEVEEKVEAPEEEKEDGEVEKEEINLDDKSEDKVCEEESKEVGEELVEKEESEEKVEDVSEDKVEDKAETEEIKEESKDEEEVDKEEEKIVKGDEDDKETEESKDEVLDTKEKKIEEEKIEESEDKGEVLDEKEEKEEIKEEKVCLEDEKVEKEEIDEKEEVKDVIEVKDSKEEIEEDEQKGGEEEEKDDKEERKVKKEDKDKIEEVTPEEILPEKVEDVKSEVEDKISEEETKVENEESAKEEEGEENFDEAKEEPELKEEETEEKEEVEEKKEKVEKVEKEEDLESKETDDVEVKKEELISTPENTEVEEESSLIKLSGGRAMKTYSKKQNVAVDRESEIENSGEEGDYRNWKKAVLLVYQRFTQHKYASIFLRPITEDHAPGYHSVIFRPMDLSTIKKNIENGTIRSTMHFQRDVMLMFQNALMYNKRNTLIYKMAMSMQEDCLQEFQMLVGVTKDVSFRRETRTAGSSSSEVNESNILKRKRSHITPSPHDSESPRMKKRKSEND